MESTVRNFWKMIYDRKSAVIVMLSDLVEGGQETSAQYWPRSGICQYGEYTVELMGEEPLQEFTIRNLSIMDIKVYNRTKSSHVILYLFG
jgi:protein tyrosine phosphatase